MIKHVNTRWLTLELAVGRCLLQFVSLKSYFLSEHCSRDRFKRLHRYFKNSVKEVYLLFYQAVLPTLPSSNKFLQREETFIHIFKPHLIHLLKDVMLKFVKPAEVQRAVRSDMLKNLEFEKIEIQSEDDRVYIGNLTRRLLTKLVDNGDISSQQCKGFFNAVGEFYLSITRYLLKWCQLDEELVSCAYWLDFKNNAEHNFESAEYFVDRFPTYKKYSKR